MSDGDEYAPAGADKETVVAEDPLCRAQARAADSLSLDADDQDDQDEDTERSTVGQRARTHSRTELIRQRIVTERRDVRVDADGRRGRVEIETPTLRIRIPLSDRNCSLEHGSTVLIFSRI